jgi:hypothetical protein
MTGLTDDERITVLMAAFCGYIMSREMCSHEQALIRAARLCTLTQITLGWADKKFEATEGQKPT